MLAHNVLSPYNSFNNVVGTVNSGIETLISSLSKSRIMPTKSKDEDRKQENGAHIISASTAYSQPWWRGNGNHVMPSSMEHITGASTMGVIPSQANDDGGNKESHAAAAQQSGNYCLFL